MNKKLIFVLTLCMALLPSFALSQMSRPSVAPSSGTTTITSGTTATSGCVAGGVLRSISNLVECGAGLTKGTYTLSSAVGAATATDSSFFAISSDHVDTIALGYLDSSNMIGSYGDGTLGAYAPLRIAGSTMTLKAGANTSIDIASTGAVTIAPGGAGVPLTLNNGANAVSPLVVQDNAAAVFEVVDGGGIIHDNNGAAANLSFATTASASNVEANHLITAGSITAKLAAYAASAGGNTLGLPSAVSSEVVGNGHLNLHSGANGDVRLGTNGAARDFIRDTVRTLTESTATIVWNIAVASGTASSGTVEYGIYATDTTDNQMTSGAFNWAAQNTGGTVTCTLSTDQKATIASTGTLTNTATCVANGNSIDIKFDATSSLTQTTLGARSTLRRNYGSGAITPS